MDIPANSATSLENWTDAQLVSGYLHHPAQSVKAYEQLVKRYYEWILQRCKRRLGNHHDAEDATQDVLLRLYQKLNLYSGDAPFTHWLARVVENHCHNLSKRLAKHSHGRESEDQLRNALVAADISEAAERSELIAGVLAKVASQIRQILQLRFFADCSLQDIATHLQISLSAVKARLYRGLQAFKQVYERTGTVTII